MRRKLAGFKLVGCMCFTFLPWNVCVKEESWWSPMGAWRLLITPFHHQINQNTYRIHNFTHTNPSLVLLSLSWHHLFPSSSPLFPLYTPPSVMNIIFLINGSVRSNIRLHIVKLTRSLQFPFPLACIWPRRRIIRVGPYVNFGGWNRSVKLHTINVYIIYTIKSITEGYACSMF